MGLLGQFQRHNDAAGVFFFAVLLLIIAVVVVLVIIGQRANFRETLQRVAAHLRGRVEMGSIFHGYDRVQFQHANRRAELRFSREGSDRHFTHLEIEWSGRPLRCEVYPETFLNSLRKLMGMEDIAIGSRRFDFEFIITGDDPEAVKALLNAQVQAAIFNIDEYIHGMHIRFSPRSLTVTSKGKITDFARLIEFIRLCRELYDAAVATAESGIEFLDGSGAIALKAGATTTTRCMVCGESLESDVVYCRSCRTPHHRDCWSYGGGCSTYGCREKNFVRS